MDFQKLLARMVELDQPIKECGQMPLSASMAPMEPVAPATPPAPPASMSVNLNAHGMDDIASLLKLMTKVNPDMINQPAPSMPTLTPPGPSISTINPDMGPLKMLPDFGDEPEGDHAEPDADNFGGPSDMDADNMSSDSDDINKAQGDLDNDGDHDIDDHELEKEGKPIRRNRAKDEMLTKTFSDRDERDVDEGFNKDMLDKLKKSWDWLSFKDEREGKQETGEEWAARYMKDLEGQRQDEIEGKPIRRNRAKDELLTKTFSDRDERDVDEAKEEYENEPDESYKSVDYMNNKLAGGMNRPKQTFPKVANGDNPMQRVKEGTDLRAAIRAELLQRLAEAKGAK